MTYRLSTDKPWSTLYGELQDEMNKWAHHRGKRMTYSVENQTAGRYRDRLVVLTYQHEGEPQIRLEMGKQATAQDNLRVLTLAIQSLRLNEVRGIADVVREAYIMLPAPAAKRDPYEVLGVRPDTDPDIVRAAYRAAAAKLHPDVEGGDAGKMAELNAAYEEIKRGD